MGEWSSSKTENNRIFITLSKLFKFEFKICFMFG